MRKPTEQTYYELQQAYDYFNANLFNSELPECLLTLQRKSARVNGYFSPKRFVDINYQSADELAMNPIHFHERGTKAVLSTLVHEMVHVWQEHHGKPGRGKYHNKQWGKKMKEIGLYPSNTGEPGGKETGDQMTHYIMEDGKFLIMCDSMIKKGFILSWAEDAPRPKDNPVDPEGTTTATVVEIVDKSNRYKYSCVTCGLNAWGKRGLKIICGACKKLLVPQSPRSKRIPIPN